MPQPLPPPCPSPSPPDPDARLLETGEPVAFTTRRTFALRSTAACAALACSPALLLPEAALAQSTGSSRLERLAALLNVFARDTFAGVSAFVVPGNDLYSLAQGVYTLLAPGGVAAKNDAYLVYMFDNYLPLPGASPLAAALAAPFNGIRLPLGDGTTVSLGSAITELFANADSVPLGAVVALILNALALVVRPSSAVGLFLSPFPRLSWADKAKVFELLEQPGNDALRVIAERIQEPITKTLIGYVQLATLGAFAFAGFGSYSEWAWFDPRTRRLLARPVGWTLSKYQPNGPVEGWDEFRGYYQGRRSASDA